MYAIHQEQESWRENYFKSSLNSSGYAVSMKIISKSLRTFIISEIVSNEVTKVNFPSFQWVVI